MLLMLPLFWIGVIRNYNHKQNLTLALCQTFNRIVDNRSFNTDDILMTLKSALSLMLYSVRDILKEFNMEVESLEHFIQNVQYVSNIQNVYGNNNAVSGSGAAKAVNR